MRFRESFVYILHSKNPICDNKRTLCPSKSENEISLNGAKGCAGGTDK